MVGVIGKNQQDGEGRQANQQTGRIPFHPILLEQLIYRTKKRKLILLGLNNE
jgi:hypothetical protein